MLSHLLFQTVWGQDFRLGHHVVVQVLRLGALVVGPFGLFSQQFLVAVSGNPDFTGCGHTCAFLQV